MPPKLPLKDRAWGTRYDSLGPSPPISPHKQAFPTPISTPVSRPTSVDINASITQDRITTTSQTTRPILRQHEKMPHDASVFVGSLPSTVEIPELTRLLREHLSQHAEVKNVKIVRDTSKSGTCAFVQCQSAAAAAQLIDTVRSHPHRPFLGRILRYEPARATRTLLISYRCPAQSYNASGGSHDTSNQLPTTNADADALPVAMRVYQAANSKFLEITYDEEAREYAGDPLADRAVAVTSPFSGAGLLLDPLQFDENDIRRIVLAFGPLEYVSSYVPTTAELNHDGVHNDYRTYPRPHNGPRSAKMNKDVWEVKWEHRNDCVNALMTLRRVSFLSVSWAHHADPSITSSVLQESPSPSTFPPTVPPAIPRAQNSYAQSHPSGSPVSSSPFRFRAERSYSNVDPTRQARMRSSTDPPTDEAAQALEMTSDGQGDARRHSNWSDTEFPPLTARKGDDQSISHPEVAHLPWSDYRLAFGGRGVPASPASSMFVNPPTTPATLSSRSHSGIPVASETSSASPHGSAAAGVSHPTSTASIVDMSSDRSTAPRTPKSTHASIPLTMHSSSARSRSYEGDFSCGPERAESSPSLSREWLMSDKPHVDRTAIFVGGLDTYSDDVWDESHLHDIFAKYGCIENIQLVRPPSKKSAFAFVKFSDAGAATKAIQEEHNRVHNGRQIRVQLRDHGPNQRSPWRSPHGRGIPSTPNPPPLRVDGWRGMSQARHASVAERSPGPKLSAGFEYQGSSKQPTMKSRTNLPSPKMPNLPHVAEVGEQSPTKPVRTGERGQEVYSRTSLPGPSPAYDHQSHYMSSATPAPSISSVGPSASMVGAAPSYSVPSVGFFAPPWVSAYPPPPYPYPVPYMPAPTYAAMPPSHSQQSRHDSAVDIVTSSGAQHMWQPQNEAQRPMIPYMPYPPAPPSYGNQHQAHIANASQGQSDQPPLQPTGFIQGQHGMLIPVYQPDALQQYMSNTEQSPSASNHQASTQPPHPSLWSQPPQYPFVPYPMSVPPMGPSPSNSQLFPQRAWMPGPAAQDASPQGAPMYHHGPLLLPPAASLTSMPSFNGAYPINLPTNVRQHMHRNAPTGASPRRFNRRDQAHAHSFANQR